MANAPLILLAYANDRDDRQRYLRNLPEEARQLRAALDGSLRAGHCQLLERPNATLDEILNDFQDSRYRGRIAIFHYAGHADSYHLLFESTTGKPAPMDGNAFARFLSQDAGSSLQVVFLNGCSTRQQVEGLLDAGVSAVLATNQAIDDAAATSFARRFYTALANGVGIGPAFGMAQAALQAAAIPLVRGVKLVGGSSPQEDRPPWDLYIRPGAESIRGWNLPQAAKDHLFGLPPLPRHDLPETPFRHLQWYDQTHAELFFGRGQEIRTLYEMVTSADAPPILLLYGQSGVGKSSLLAAGLLPRLEGRFLVRYGRRDPTSSLLGSLSTMLGSPSPDGIADTWQRLEAESGLPLLLILDQVEEAYTRQGGAGDEEFAALLEALQPLFAAKDQRPRGRLLLSFRKEWLPDAQKLLKEKRLAYGELFLKRLGKEGVMEAVAGPATNQRLQQQYGLQIDPELPGRLADDLLEDAGAAVAPTLQILLTQMWKAAKEEAYDKPAFSTALYTQLKRKGILLMDFLAQQLQGMRAQQPGPVDSGLVLELLYFHTTFLGTAEERSQADLSKMYAHQQALLPGMVKELQERYLLADSAQHQLQKPPATRLAHDALAPLVQERFARSNAPGQQARRILESRAVQWRDGKVGAALDDEDLGLVKSGLAGMRALDGDEARLLEVSQRQANIRKRDRLIVTSSLGVLVAILLIVLGFDALRNFYLQRQAVRATEVVRVGNLVVDKYEVRVGLYNRCVEAGRCLGVETGVEDVDLPITNVNAFRAAEYCAWLGARMPTSQEWDEIVLEVFPSRGIGQPRYDIEHIIMGADAPVPVTSLWKDSTGGPVGLIGNVLEWTSTVVSSDSASDKDGNSPIWNGTDRTTLIMRGGSFNYPLRYRELSDLQIPVVNDVPASDFGFRCVNN